MIPHEQYIANPISIGRRFHLNGTDMIVIIKNNTYDYNDHLLGSTNDFKPIIDFVKMAKLADENCLYGKGHPDPNKLTIIEQNEQRKVVVGRDMKIPDPKEGRVMYYIRGYFFDLYIYSHIERNHARIMDIICAYDPRLLDTRMHKYTNLPAFLWGQTDMEMELGGQIYGKKFGISTS